MNARYKYCAKPDAPVRGDDVTRPLCALENSLYIGAIARGGLILLPRLLRGDEHASLQGRLITSATHPLGDDMIDEGTRTHSDARPLGFLHSRIEVRGDTGARGWGDMVVAAPVEGSTGSVVIADSLIDFCHALGAPLKLRSMQTAKLVECAHRELCERSAARRSTVHDGADEQPHPRWMQERGW
eukprot:scaffold27649_cov33-Tisochrysis_lutea.AAC.1